jgi:hypothetical protein
VENIFSSNYMIFLSLIKANILRLIKPTMKKTLITFIMLLGISSLMAQNWIPVTANAPSSASKQLLNSNIQTTNLQFSLDGFYLYDVETPEGRQQIVRLDGTSSILEQGAPDLAKMTASIIIPAQEKMEVVVVSSSYRDFENINIAPSKGNFTRDIDPATVAYEYGDVYNQNAFYPAIDAELRAPHIIRDYRGQTVVFYPFRYNPVTKTLRVYYEAELSIRSTGEMGVNTLTQVAQPETISSDFSLIYNKHFLNYSSASRYTPLEEDGSMLIICYDDFMAAMNPFVEWKTISGMTVEMENASQFSSATEIKSFIADYYNTNGLTYVLLVGDANQVPTINASSGHSDQSYGYIDGSDSYAEVFVGRFSAESVADVEIQVTKAVEYEKTPNTNGTWMSHNVGIASDQGPGDDNEYDYQHIRNIQADLIGYTWETSAELFDGSQGGLDAGGSPSPSDVANEVNAGTSIICYTGHGSTTSWGSSGFSNSDVNALVNDNMLPYILSVACVNGNFVNNTCFAEAWLRASNGDEPSGAVATIMSTINQSWDPPMHGQDAMVDILVESFSDNIKRTFGGVTVNGCFEMNDEYGSGGDEMTDTWTIFGDPSLMLYTKMPAVMNATYEPIIPIDANTFNVSTNATDGRAALSYNGQLLGVGYLNNGNTVINLSEPLTSTMLELDLVIVGFNFEPHIATVQITAEPGQVMSPSPSNGKLNVYPFTQLQWADGVGGDPTTYKLFVGTDNPPTNLVNGEEISEDFYSFVNDLDYETEYFWRVDAINDFGTTEGEVWHFFVAQPPSEDFETGSFMGNAWTMEGDADWTITDSPTFHGAYAARSGAISDDQVSTLKIELDAEGFMSHIKFFRMVSTDGSDKLRFYIDGNMMGEWGGLSQWTEETFNVTSGHHVFEWKYEKGAANAGGDDAVWVDFIYFPTLSVLSANAGQDMQVCEGNSCTLNGSGSGYTSATWSTSGDGSFDDVSKPDAIYTPGATDIANGSVELTFEVSDGDASDADNMLLTIDAAPLAYAGGEITICGNGQLVLEAAQAENYETLIWETEGDGVFDDAGRLHAIYTPGPTDIENGSVNLILKVQGAESCGEVLDMIAVGVLSEPAAPQKPVGPEIVLVNQIEQSEFTIELVEGATDYEWAISDQNAGDLNFEENNATITWNVDYVGAVELTAIAKNNCGSSESSEALLITIDNNVGIGNLENEDFSFYPNPTSGAFTIQANIGSKLRILNLVGAEIYSINETTEANTQIELSDVPNGVYYLIRESAQGNQVKKLIINK